MRCLLTLLMGITLAGSWCPTLPASTPRAISTEHPYLMWTRQDLRALRQQIETQSWAKQAYEEMVASPERDGEDLRLLFRYAVMGDQEAGEIQKKRLLSLLKAPEPLGAAIQWRILAYDLLYDELSRPTNVRGSNAGCGATSNTPSSPAGRTTRASSTTRRTTPATTARTGGTPAPTGCRTSSSPGSSARTWPRPPWATSD